MSFAAPPQSNRRQSLLAEISQCQDYFHKQCVEIELDDADLSTIHVTLRRSVSWMPDVHVVTRIMCSLPKDYPSESPKWTLVAPKTDDLTVSRIALSNVVALMDRMSSVNLKATHGAKGGVGSTDYPMVTDFTTGLVRLIKLWEANEFDRSHIGWASKLWEEDLHQSPTRNSVGVDSPTDSTPRPRHYTPKGGATFLPDGSLLRWSGPSTPDVPEPKSSSILKHTRNADARTVGYHRLTSLRSMVLGSQFAVETLKEVQLCDRSIHSALKRNAELARAEESRGYIGMSSVRCLRGKRKGLAPSVCLSSLALLFAPVESASERKLTFVRHTVLPHITMYAEQLLSNGHPFWCGILLCATLCPGLVDCENTSLRFPPAVMPVSAFSAVALVAQIMHRCAGRPTAGREAELLLAWAAASYELRPIVTGDFLRDDSYMSQQSSTPYGLERTASYHPDGEAAVAVTLSMECAICCSEVTKGLVLRCSNCGHGGHEHHLRRWFSTETLCPCGCDCECVFQSF